MRAKTAALLVAGLTLSSPLRAQSIYDNACPLHPALTQAQLTNKIARAIFQVVVQGADGVQRANGTATLIDARGYMLTAGHVIDGYGDGSAGTITLRRYDGVAFQAHVVESFLPDGVDVAVLSVANFPIGTADPVSLRIDSPEGPGAPGSGVVLAYDNGSSAMRNPVTFTVGGYATDTSTMTLGFAAIGGNSGSLLLEPSGRAFGLLREGPDQTAMQIPLFVPQTLVPSRNGKFALPDIPIEMLPEDLQAAVAAAVKSKALPVSSFWDRLAKAVPPSPLVNQAMSDLRASGWRNVVVSMDSAGGYHLSSTDLVHLFQQVGKDDDLLQRTVVDFGQAMNVITETCSEAAFRQFVLMRIVKPLAARAAVSKEKSATASLARGATSRVLAAAVRSAAVAPDEAAGGQSLRELVSDLAIVEANRSKLGEVTPNRAEQMVAIAEGLGGTPTTGELAALYAAKAGDSRSGAAYLAIADRRLRQAPQGGSKRVLERRETISRLFAKFDGIKTFGVPVSRVTTAKAQAQLSGASASAPVVRSIAAMTPDSAKLVAQSIHAF